MRTMVRHGRGARLALAGLVALLAALALPGVAGAATHAAKVGNISVSPSLAGHPEFGLYRFDVTAASPGDSFAFPFLTGSKIGHCVEATVLANNNASTLRTTSDLSLSNSDPANTLGNGLTVGAQRVEWILLDSYRASPGDATGVEGAAHQSAIWHLTNPSSPNVIDISGGSANEKAAIARSAQLVTDSQTSYASVNNAADLSVDGGASVQTCGGTSRTVTVTGSPFTDATLTLTGPGHFHTGGSSTTVNLGAAGKAQIQVDSTGPGAIDVTASIKVATMVQADNGGNQDFVYLEFQTVSKKVSIVFTDCQNLQISKTATPSFTRAYDWTITKAVDKTTVTTAADSATFTYTVVATKSAATDSGYAVTGTISVTNPNVNSVSNVQVLEKGVDNGGVCVLGASGALGTLAKDQTGTVSYTCTYAAPPAPAAGTNTAQVSWTMPDGGSPQVVHSASVSQPFAFGDPTTVVHDAVNVGDIFDGAAPVTFADGAGLTSSRTFTYSRTVPVPASGCRVFDNTANITATDVPSYSKDASATVQTCRKTPPVVPAGVPSRTTISLTKHAASSRVKAGGTALFTIVWKNTGKAAAKHVVICDNLPEHMTFVSAARASYRDGKVCWMRRSVASGTALTFRVVARVDAGVGNVKLVNVATATAGNAKPARAEAPVRALRNTRTRAGGVTG
jgi:uncharacterized repeat protein (TIGR01451 family)